MLAEAASWDGRIVELLAPNAMTRRIFDRVWKASAAWDGTTAPVRPLVVSGRTGGLVQTLMQRIGRWVRESPTPPVKKSN